VTHPCPQPPANRVELCKRLAAELTKTHGRKRFYSIGETRQAMRKLGTPLDFYCWGHAFFCSHADFDAHHRTLGQSCDYAQMKSQMISDVTNGASEQWLNFDVDWSWLQWPDIDVSSIFDVFN
jgi:hypothetical protein